MNLMSVAEAAKKWGMSERSVRAHCQRGDVVGACLVGKTWTIPEEAEKPCRRNGNTTLANVLRREKENKTSGGIYHKIQVEMTYNSNHIEGSKLTFEQTRYIFETNTIGFDGVVNVDDVVEATNHFRCVDMIIDEYSKKLSERFIKKLHAVLTGGTKKSREEWFNVGEYKKLPNEVGGKITASPEEVARKMKELISNYNSLEKVTFDDVLDFHYKFESIHPFQDGNGRVGRLIMFKECLRLGYVPFIIDDELKMYYYRGLDEWTKERGYLLDTCLTAQDKFKTILSYFKIYF